MSQWLLMLPVAMILFAGAALARGEELKPGDEAPDFELTGTDGKTHKLSDFKGKQVVVVAWFPKAKTGGCTKECKSLKESGEVLKKFKVAYFTASCDDVKLNTEFAEELELDYPILSDPTRKTARAYGLVEDDKGNAKRWTFYIGKDGKIAFIDKDVKTMEHGQHIAAKLAELKVEKK